MKKYFWLILILIGIPSLSLAQIRLGILPIKWKGSGISSEFKRETEKNILENLKTSQLILIPLKEKEKSPQIHYILNISIESSKNFSIVNFHLKENISSKSIYSKKEKIENSQLPFKIKSFCEELKTIIFNSATPDIIASLEKESFWSKVNPFNKINNLFLKIFSTKEEFEVKIPIPPPPPPPGYYANPVPQINSQSIQSVYPQPSLPTHIPEEKHSLSSWQWF